MKKIQKIIDNCYDCEYRFVFSGMSGGNTKAHICTYVNNDAEEQNDASEPFLLDLCSNGSNALPIPANCPLEDYKETPK